MLASSLNRTVNAQLVGSSIVHATPVCTDVDNVEFLIVTDHLLQRLATLAISEHAMKRDR